MTTAETRTFASKARKNLADKLEVMGDWGQSSSFAAETIAAFLGRASEAELANLYRLANA